MHISSGPTSLPLDDPEIEIRLLRAQEISRYVEQGFLDCGLTGHDWIIENASDVETVCELTFSKASSGPTRWSSPLPRIPTSAR